MILLNREASVRNKWPTTPAYFPHALMIVCISATLTENILGPTSTSLSTMVCWNVGWLQQANISSDDPKRMKACTLYWSTKWRCAVSMPITHPSQKISRHSTLSLNRGQWWIATCPASHRCAWINSHCGRCKIIIPFERIRMNLPTSLDPQHFANHRNKSIADVIAPTLNSSQEHLDNKAKVESNLLLPVVLQCLIQHCFSWFGKDLSYDTCDPETNKGIKVKQCTDFCMPIVMVMQPSILL